MRMQKVEPALAEQWVNTAVTGGVFTSNDDPRLEIFAEPGYINGPIVGLPNGLYYTTIEDPVNNPLGLVFFEFAYFRYSMMGYDDPSIGLNYAEVLFMQAEAVLRGWITGDATALYEAGVAASMTMWDIYPGVWFDPITVPDAAATEANYDAMVARQGPDLFTTRVWWDVE